MYFFLPVNIFAGGIPASLGDIPGAQPPIITRSADKSEFVDFSPLLTHHPGHTYMIAVVIIFTYY